MKLNEAVSFVQDTDIVGSAELKESSYDNDVSAQYAGSFVEQASPKANMFNLPQGRHEMRDYNITMLKKSYDVETYLAEIINMYKSGDNITKYKRKVKKLYKAIERAINKPSSDRSQEGHLYMVYLGEMAENAQELIKQQSRQ